jgi:hypothetical protein
VQERELSRRTANEIIFRRRACFRKFASESDRSHRIKIRRFSLLVSTVCTFFRFAADTLPIL